MVTFKQIGIVAMPPVQVEELQRATIHFKQGRVTYKGSETSAHLAPWNMHPFMISLQVGKKSISRR
jgi:hypothetical protein